MIDTGEGRFPSIGRHKKEVIGRALCCYAIPIIIAYGCRLAGKFGLPHYTLLAYVRSAIYILMFASFALSAPRRIMQVQVRKYLTAIDWMMVFLMVTRTVRYTIDMLGDAGYSVAPFLGVMHGMWYLYYLPLIFIPLLTLFASCSICRSEDYRISPKLKLLYIPAIALLLLVLTNDLHQFVFFFPPDSPPYLEEGYRYGIGFYGYSCWTILCYLFAMVSVFLQNRMPDKRRRILIPVGILALMLLYDTLNALHIPFVNRWLADFPVISSLCLVAFFESLFRLNLIQTNSRYDELFRGSSAGAVIMDSAYRTITASNNYAPLPESVLHAAADAPVLLDGNIRLSSAPITGGRVFWTEDVSELSEVLEELADKHEYLTERERALGKEVETQQKKHRLRERNRLFNELIGHTKKEIDRYDGLLDALERTSDKEQTQVLLTKLAVVCTHIKRRSNLIFLADNTELVELNELEHAVNEWLSGLRLRGVRCRAVYDLDGYAPLGDMLTLYEGFSRILYQLTDSLQSLMVRAFLQEGKPRLLISAGCGREMEAPAIPGVSVSDEGGGEWVFQVSAREGGEAK